MRVRAMPITTPDEEGFIIYSPWGEIEYTCWATTETITTMAQAIAITADVNRYSGKTETLTSGITIETEELVFNWETTPPNGNYTIIVRTRPSTWGNPNGDYHKTAWAIQIIDGNASFANGLLALLQD